MANDGTIDWNDTEKRDEDYHSKDANTGMIDWPDEDSTDETDEEPDNPPFGERTFARVTKSLPGHGRLVQVWVLRSQCVPGDEMHHAVVESFVGDINVVGNQKLPSEDSHKTIRDPGIQGWKSVPDDVKDALAECVPDGTTVLGGDGGQVEL